METVCEFNFAGRKTKPARWPWLLAAVWICASLAGMWILWVHAETPGTPAQPPARR